ncbi:MAG: PIG-L family deacetylase [Anaerotruncus sp.]|nr:PIG-L family deacetylase [Anaerotruncus sp.]
MGKKDILVVSAHAADYCTRAGGTIARYIREGYKVHIIALTCGARGESGDYWKNNPNGTVEECSDIRRRESQAAADFLGATIEFLNYNDYPLTIDEQRQRYLTRRLLDIRPELIFTHWLKDPTNPDHAITAEAVIKAMNSGSQIGAFPNTPPHYYANCYFFEPTVPIAELNEFAPDFYVDIGETYQTKLDAIAKFECQPQLAGFYQHFAAHRAFQAKIWTKRNIQYVEGFKRFTPYVGTMLPESQRDDD